MEPAGVTSVGGVFYIYEYRGVYIGTLAQLRGRKVLDIALIQQYVRHMHDCRSYSLKARGPGPPGFYTYELLNLTYAAFLLVHCTRHMWIGLD
jgi:hypothetical protein